MSKEERMHEVASDFSVALMYTLAKHFNTTVDVVIKVYDKTGYWKVVNNDELMCIQAHCGEEEVIERLEADFNEVLSRDNTQF